MGKSFFNGKKIEKGKQRPHKSMAKRHATTANGSEQRSRNANNREATPQKIGSGMRSDDSGSLNDDRDEFELQKIDEEGRRCRKKYDCDRHLVSQPFVWGF